MSDNDKRVAAIEVLRQLITGIEKETYALYYIEQGDVSAETKQTIISALEFAVEHMQFYNIESKRAYDTKDDITGAIKRLIVEF